MTDDLSGFAERVNDTCEIMREFAEKAKTAEKDETLKSNQRKDCFSKDGKQRGRMWP